MNRIIIAVSICFFSCTNPILEEFQKIDEAQKKSSKSQSEKLEDLMLQLDYQQVKADKLFIDQRFNYIDSINNEYLMLVKANKIQLDDIEFSTQFFFDSGRAASIKEEIVELNAFIQDRLKGKNADSLRHFIIQIDDFNNADGTVTPWEEINFSNVPNIAQQSILNKILADIRKLEADYLEEIYF